MTLQKSDIDDTQQLLIDECVNAKLFDSVSFQSILDREEESIQALLRKPNNRHEISKVELLAIFSGLIAWPGVDNRDIAQSLVHLKSR